MTAIAKVTSKQISQTLLKRKYLAKNIYCITNFSFQGWFESDIFTVAK